MFKFWKRKQPSAYERAFDAVKEYPDKRYLFEMLLKEHMPTHHLQAYPKPKISEEVMLTRAHI